jgi:hypothetical protein
MEDTEPNPKPVANDQALTIVPLFPANCFLRPIRQRPERRCNFSTLLRQEVGRNSFFDDGHIDHE